MKRVMKVIKWLLGVIPSKTPIGATAFDMWASSIFDSYGFPNTPGYRQALATMLMHEKSYFVSKFKLAVALHKHEVNQTAYSIMKDIQQQREAAEALNAPQKETTESEVNSKSVVQQA